MTPPDDLAERARAIIKRRKAYLDLNGWSDDFCERILVDFAQAERRWVWEKIQTELESRKRYYEWVPNTDKADATIALLQWCRQRAQEEGA